LAILDVNLNGKMSFPAADIIIRRRIPLIFASGYALDNIPAAFGSTPKLRKPFQIATLAKAITAAREGARHSGLVRRAVGTLSPPLVASSLRAIPTCYLPQEEPPGRSLVLKSS
jgi:hypothetical protein